MIPEINVLAWINGAPVVFGIAVAIAIGATIWFYRVISYHRQPTPQRIADYAMSMPHIHHRFKVSLFGLPIQLHSEILETFRKVGAGQLAEFFEKNADKMHFYVAKHLPYEAGTIESGMSIIMSESPLHEGQFYEEYDESFNVIKGTETRFREVSQSTKEGMVWLKARKWRREVVNLIYYPAVPVTKNATVVSAQLESIQVAMSVVPTIDVLHDDIVKSNYNKMRADSADRAKDNAMSKNKTSTEEKNMYKHAFSLQEYFQQSAINQGGPLSIFLVIGIVGACAVLLPDMIQRQLPGYTPQQYIGFAVGIGAAIVGLISMLRK